MQPNCITAKYYEFVPVLSLICCLFLGVCILHLLTVYSRSLSWEIINYTAKSAHSSCHDSSELLHFEPLSFVLRSSFSYLFSVRLHSFPVKPDMHSHKHAELVRCACTLGGEVRCWANEVEELAKWLGKICHPAYPPPPPVLGGGRERGIGPKLGQPCCCNRKQGPWLTWQDVENNPSHSSVTPTSGQCQGLQPAAGWKVACQCWTFRDDQN